MAGGAIPFPDSDPGDEFSNNLISDLGPLLALFGEEVAKQFMSESMGWADHIIFAMAPIGIITTIVGAIRIGGSRWLKALIGRAKENLAFAEAELVSSTSSEVCEMFNGQHVVRITGAPAITEFICMNQDDGRETEIVQSPIMSFTKGTHFSQVDKKYQTWKLQDAVIQDVLREKVRNTAPVLKKGIDFFQQITKIQQLRTKARDLLTPGKTISQEGDLENQVLATDKNGSSITEHPQANTPQPDKTTLHSPGGSKKSVGSTIKSGSVITKSPGDSMDDGPPNISLNMHSRTGRGELYAAAVIGITLQLAVLIYDWFITYYPGFKQKKGGEYMPPYAFPTTSIGVLALVLGMLICCYITESSTADKSYVSDKENLHMVWIQRAGVVSDQIFESYVLVARHKRHVVTSSRRAKRTDVERFSAESLTFFGAVAGIIGFVLQFVGLRAMHWSASIAQLSATITMVLLRAYVRRGLSESPHAQEVMKGYELDWLATRIAENTDALCKIPNSKDPGSAAEDKNMAGFWSDDCFKWGVSTVGSFDGSKLLRNGTEPPQTTENEKESQTQTARAKLLRVDTETPQRKENEKESQKQTARAMKVVEARMYLGRTADWHGPIMERAISVASAIEAMVELCIKKESKEKLLVWSIDNHGCGEIKFSLKRGDNESAWRADIGEIHAVLSLWLFSVARKELESNASKLKDGIEGDRGGATSKNESLRLLGPMNKSHLRYMRWWLGAATGLLKEVEIQNLASTARASDSLDTQSPGSRKSTSRPTEPHTEPAALQSSTSEPLLNIAQFETHRIVGCKSEVKALAVISNAPLDMLYAQDIFASFAWAFFQSPFSNRIPGLTTVQEPRDSFYQDINGLFESITLNSTEMLRLVKKISQTGLGTVEDILYTILPPLTIEGKLPDMHTVIQFVREKGREEESCRRWEKAGRLYVGGLEACKGFKQEAATYEATCALTEFIRRLTIDIEVTEACRTPESELPEGQNQIKELTDLKKKIVEELKDHADTDLLKELANVYRTQDRVEGVSEWKPLVENRKSQAEDMEEVIRSSKPKRMAPHYWTKLHNYVSVSDEKKMLELLKNEAPNPNSQDFAGLTPLHYATKPSIAVKLLSQGAFVTSIGYDRFTPLHSAARRGDLLVVKVLIRHGADLNARDTDQRTPLHWAAQVGQSKVMRYLLKKGADPQPRAEHGRRPLHMVASGGHQEAAKVLLETEGVDANLQDMDGRTALHLATIGRHDMLVHTIADTKRGSWAQDRFGWTAIHLAAFMGHSDVVTAFLTLPPPTSGNKSEELELQAEELKNRLDLTDRNKRSTLHIAVKLGKMLVVEALLNANINKEATDNVGDTPLMYAAYYRKPNILEYLLDMGCEIKSPNYNGQTPLHYAAYGESKGSPEAVKILLERNADVDPKDQDGFTPLLWAAMHNNSTAVGMLLGQGADKHAKDSKGRTAIRLAAEFEREEVINKLLEQGADVEAKDDNGSTALHTATRQGQLPITIALLNSKANIHAKDPEGRTALHLAAEFGWEEGVKELLGRGADIKAKDNNENTPLHSAAQQGQLLIMKALLNGAAGIHTRNSKGRTALHLAAEFGLKDGVKELLDRGADIQEKDNDGNTPLHIAAWKGRLSIISAFLDFGADIHAKNSKGRTALHLAAAFELKGGVKELIDRGADIQAKDNNGNTPLHAAAWKGQLSIIRAFLHFNADIHAKNSKGRTALHLAVESKCKAGVTELLKRGADVHAKDDNGNTPLHTAARGQQLPIINDLLHHKADIDVKGSRGRTALYLAIEFRWREGVKALLDRGADIQAKSDNGDTPLNMAVRQNELPIIEDLLSRKELDINAEGECGIFALDIAVLRGYKEIISTLLEAGAVIRERVGDKAGTIELVDNEEILAILEGRNTSS